MLYRIARTTTFASLLTLTGCMVGPIVDNPMFVRFDPTINVSNPLWVPSPGVEDGGYGKVFEKVLDVLDDYFEIAYANRYDGHLRTFPRIAPGYEQIWKPGSPDAYQRLEATLQTMRHRCHVYIEPAQDGGYFIRVVVYKELEDLPRPIRATAGAAAFLSEITVERQYEVVDPTVFEGNWIPVGPDGRDHELEQALLQRIKKCL